MNTDPQDPGTEPGHALQEVGDRIRDGVQQFARVLSKASARFRVAHDTVQEASGVDVKASLVIDTVMVPLSEWERLAEALQPSRGQAVGDTRPLLDWREDGYMHGDRHRSWFGSRGGVTLATVSATVDDLRDPPAANPWHAVAIGADEGTDMEYVSEGHPTREAAQVAAETDVCAWFYRVGARLEDR